jgi:hypothetical protein
MESPTNRISTELIEATFLLSWSKRRIHQRTLGRGCGSVVWSTGTRGVVRSFQAAAGGAAGTERLRARACGAGLGAWGWAQPGLKWSERQPPENGN